MLRCLLKTVSGKTLERYDALSVTVNMEENVPADDAVLIFPYNGKTEEITEIELFDGKNVVFSGVSDEQHMVIKDKSAYLKINARSMAALLLDNEARPICYNKPSLDVLFNSLARPFGIKSYDGGDVTFHGSQTVYKGQSCFKVLYTFFKNCFSRFPRITPDKRLSLSLEGENKSVVFSDGGDGIDYVYFKESIKRHKEISKVYLKLQNACGYSVAVDNEDALKRGITAQRYLNAAALDITPASCAYKMIENSKSDGYDVQLCLKGRFLDLLGANAVIKNKTAGEITDVYIYKIRYSLTSENEQTVINLKRRK